MTKIETNRYQSEVVALSKQLLHLQQKMGALENRYLEVEKNESKWQKLKESSDADADAEIDRLRKELSDFKQGEKRHWTDKRRHF